MPVVDFDYDGLDDCPPEAAARLVPAMATFLMDVTDWATRGPRGQSSAVGIRIRFTVACWIMSPRAFGDISQTQIADRLKVTRVSVDRVVNSFVRRFGLKKKRSGKAGRWVFVWG